ncbi:Metallo-dependent phosphatase, partial [Setomelanomma holmii]
RKTRIVCISDTHNQTPKLPPGDILIHAGDLTNQGSLTELQKSVAWLERQPFEAKIVVAGNHDTTLDAPFFHSHSSTWKWPTAQDPVECKKLVMQAHGVTYLENETATIYLTKETGPKTCLSVFGSPFSPGRRGWAFQYWGADEAEQVWSKIGDGVDVLVTHTPAYGFVDAAGGDGAARAGCEVLRRRLGVVRPLVHVCGHIHGGRGVERVRWRNGDGGGRVEQEGLDSLVEVKEAWSDSGKGNKKLSLVDLTKRGGKEIHNAGLTRHVMDESLRDLFESSMPESEGPQSGTLEANPTSSLDDVALRDSEAESWTRKAGGAVEWRHSDIGRSEVDAQEKAMRDRHETVMINAAFLGPRDAGPMTFNKPIVVDVELPVWE